MSARIPLTEFVTSERVPIEVIKKQASVLTEAPFLAAFANSAGNAVFILNQQRQIVFASESARKLTSFPDMDSVLGRRPGEALGCVHAKEFGENCGASEYCEHCGALQAIISSLGGKSGIQECRLTRIMNFNTEALDLLVYATPFTYRQEEFTILSVSDISHEKRRRALERVFCHDLVNLTSGLEAYVGRIETQVPGHLKAEMERMHDELQQLVEEVFSQKELAAAENNALEPHPEALNAQELLAQLQESYQKLPVARDRLIRVRPRAAPVEFVSDRILLRRVLGNLTKNALEAVQAGQEVTLSFQKADGRIQFQVQNPSFMPREVQLQVFKRSYSTKGTGRGLGTYSAKLLTERYLHGQVSFSSTVETGTLFTITLPEKMSNP
jgi:nitrogen fixation/metabolism regulation signal transduction histidine kinase